MQNLHDDKNLDRLSREAADEFTPDHSLHSWEQLKAGLDKELPEKKEKKRRFIFILFFFLLVGGGIVSSLLWFGSNENGIKKEVGVIDKKSKASSSNSSNPYLVTQPKTSIDAVKKDEVKTVAIDAPEKKKAVAVKKAVSRKSITHDKTRDEVVAERKNDNSTKITVGKSSTFTEDKTNEKTDDNAPATNAPSTDTVATKSEPVTADSTTTKNTPVETTDSIQTPTKSKLTSKSRNPSVAASRWEFGAVYAPDISTVKFTHTQKPGTNIGLTIGYNISRRFTIQTGAIYTTKNYKSRGSDYHPPKGYWTEYVKLETVTADCNMWDIPINLRYNLVPRHRTNLFVSTGLSSYLMRTESYDYRYYYVNNPNPMYRERSYDTNTKHWLSVLNLSVGYERQLSKSFAIQAEPFFKQPLKGVGFGKVKLNSTGIFLSVKYKPVARSRK